MSRHALPIDILVARGKSHIGQAEIQRRKNTEIRIGSNKLVCPEFVMEDPVAFSKWHEVTGMYKKSSVQIISSTDVSLIGRYCKTYSDYIELLNVKKKLSILESETDTFVDCVTQLIKIDKSINAKMGALVQMEDRLFLNPLSKVKNVAAPTKKEIKNPDAELFE